MTWRRCGIWAPSSCGRRSISSVWDVVIFSAAFMAVVTMTVATGCALTVRSIRRANRVVPERRDAAPTGWLWSLREPARLHRRLKRAVRLTRAAMAQMAPMAPARTRRRDQPTSALTAIADDLVYRAAAIDDQLVAAARIRPLLRGLGREVAEVERAAWRLAGTAAAWRAQLQQAALAQPLPGLDAGSRLDAFEAAMAELSSLGHVSYPSQISSAR
jgi:hypothetical protein